MIWYTRRWNRCRSIAKFHDVKMYTRCELRVHHDGPCAIGRNGLGNVAKWETKWLG